MKITLLSGSMYAIPTMHFLASEKMLANVVVVGNVTKNNIQLQQNAEHLNIPFKRFQKNELLTAFRAWLGENQPDMVLVFGFNNKLPVELLSMPKLGFYNVHFSLLPAYRGRNPVFWVLKNRDNVSGVTIHKMAEDYDTGPILGRREVAIQPGDSYGIFSARLSLETTGLIARGIATLENLDDNTLEEQDEARATYCPPPSLNDLRIDWEMQSAAEIESLVNATNPDYGGAIAFLRGQTIRILEVTNAQLTNPVEVSPGTIVHSDTNHGIFVACKNAQYLRLNIIHSSEGIFSGFKLAGMGIQAGECFGNGNG